jgi:hypothetical protein
MDILHGEDYTQRVMATAQALRNALGEVEFDIGVNALITLLAECSKHSELSERGVPDHDGGTDQTSDGQHDSNQIPRSIRRMTWQQYDSAKNSSGPIIRKCEGQDGTCHHQGRRAEARQRMGSAHLRHHVPEVKPIISQVPAGWLKTVDRMDIEQVGDAKCDMQFTVATPAVPWPNVFVTTDVAKKERSYSDGIVLTDEHVWAEFYMQRLWRTTSEFSAARTTTELSSLIWSTRY